MLGLLHVFLGEWLTIGLAIVALVGAAFCDFRVPVVGRPLAIFLLAVGVFLLAWRAGYVTRARQDESASLRARIEVLEYDNKIAAIAERDARDRAASLELQASAAQDRISGYEQFLATQKPAPGGLDVCRITDDDINRGLLGAGAGPRHAAKPPTAP